MTSAGADRPPSRRRGAASSLLFQVLNQETLDSRSSSPSPGSTGSSPSPSFSTSPWQTAGRAGAAAKQAGKRSSADAKAVDAIEEKLARLKSPSKPAEHGGEGSAGVLHASSSVCMDIDQEDGGAPALQQPTASRSQQPTASRSARETVDLIAKRLAELKSPTKESAGDAAWRLHQCKPSCACAHAFDEEVRSSGLLALKGPESDAVGPEPEDSSRLSNALVPYSHQSQQSSAPSLPIVPEPVHEALKAPSDVSLLGHGAVVLKQTGITLSRNEFRAICEKQRNTRNFWKTGFIFPGQEHLPAADRNIFDRESLIRTKQFVCYGLMGCPYGDCLHQLETIDISAGRTRLANTVATKQTSKSAAGKTKETNPSFVNT